MKRFNLICLLCSCQQSSNVILISPTQEKCNNINSLIEAIDSWTDYGIQFESLGCIIDSTIPSHIDIIVDEEIEDIDLQYSDNGDVFMYIVDDITGRQGESMAPELAFMRSDRKECKIVSAILDGQESPVFMHELGHYLGLNHEDDIKNVMYEMPEFLSATDEQIDIAIDTQKAWSHYCD